ncbi:MAG TPA: amidohydrolase family protein [Longimicrobiaceae bacterium]|nr:amidohydrolase family protein [Longimicrobiaceae bacterium]
MLTLIENGDVYAPEPLGRRSVLLTDGKIAKVGKVDRAAVEALGLECDVIDAKGCIVAPGLIDPHQHLLGGSGEGGFHLQSPEFFIGEIVRFGITTVVGVLGVDTTMKTMAGLLAKVKALKQDGMNAFLWTGGYSVPPTSIMSTVRDDILFLDEVIGAGEVAISDPRGQDPSPEALARLAHDCYVGGHLSGKAGLLHLHVGEGDTRLDPLVEMLDGYNVQPEWLYPTHVERTTKLFDQAVGLAKQGMAIDVDVVEEDLPKWVRRYREKGGPPERLTVSSDASLTSPRLLFEQLRSCVLEHGMEISEVLALATRNSAGVLKLEHKGRLAPGCMGDVLIMRKKDWEVVHVLSRGVFMVNDGELVKEEGFLARSNREIRLTGQKDGKNDGSGG